jgi:hypothetical protein
MFKKHLNLRPVTFFGTRIVSAVLLLSMLLSFGVAVQGNAEAQENQDCGKPRTVVLHDPELDDLNTLSRYLLYSNDFDTQGLVYQSSSVHWKGDGQGTVFTGESEHSRFGITDPLTSWRWNADESFIEDTVEVYAEVYTNLSVHAEGYPDPEDLRSKIYVGNVAFPGDISEDSAGSDLIKSLLLDDNSCPVWLLTGAGQSTIGRALLSIAEEYQDTDEWSAIYEKVSDKAIISSFGDQDGVYADYIGPNWPDIEFRQMSTQIWGYGARSAVLPGDEQYLSAAWMRENVSEVGPFGAIYRVWGDGKQMVAGDISDHFGFSGLNTEQLRALGYVVWTAPQEQGSWISEGDTSMWMDLLDNGLRGDEDPTWGGWGGRVGEDINPDTNAVDANYDSARWFGTAQRDFAARLQWSVTPEYADANHNPVVEVLSPESTTVHPGEVVTLTARATDPDGDHLVGHWWQYEEAGTYPGAVLAAEEQASWFGQAFAYPAQVVPGDPAIADVIEDEIEVTTQFTVPTDVVDGQTLHFIIEVTDNGSPNLTSYQRVVLTIER